MTEFTTQYFKNKFIQIPDDEWATGDYSDDEGRRCALGHCGELDADNPTEESLALEKLFETQNLRVSIVNDGESPLYKQASPKQRILAALESMN